MQIKLSEIVIDPLIQVRDVEPRTVTAYAQAMDAGAKFPPVVLDAATNRMVCGNHRYYAYKSRLNPDDMVSCVFKKFDNEKEIIKYAAQDNSQHGRPLATWDKKRIIFKLKELGADVDEIASTLSIPVARVETLAGMVVYIVGKRDKKTFRQPFPVKHGMEHMIGKDVKLKDYQEHVEKDRGVPAVQLATSLNRWITNGWINSEDDKTVAALHELYISLDELFKKVKAA